MLLPCIDEIDHGRPKAALAELQKYLKKAPQRSGTLLVEALRCLCLHRMGQFDKAYETFLKMATEGSQSDASSSSAPKSKIIKGKNGKVIKKPPQAVTAPAKKPEPSAAPKTPAERKWKDLPDNILFTLGHALKPMGKCEHACTDFHRVRLRYYQSPTYRLSMLMPGLNIATILISAPRLSCSTFVNAASLTIRHWRLSFIS